MGRSFESVRMGVQELSERWLKARRALWKENQVYAERLVEMDEAARGASSLPLMIPLRPLSSRCLSMC